MPTNQNNDENSNQGRNGNGTISKLPAVSGISLPATERLRGRENYTSWAFATKMLLIREGTWDAVARGEEDPVDAISLRALATICLSIEPVNYSLVQSAETAKAAWTNLKNAFQDDGMTRRIGLLRKLTSIRLSECNSVEEYVSQMMSTSHKLSEVGFKVDDTWLASLLLMGLPEMYEPMIMGLEASGTRITADAVKAKILQDVKMSSVAKSSSSDGAFYSHPNKSKQKEKASVKCFKCKRLGHFASECQKREANDNKKEKKSGKQAAFSVRDVPTNVREEWIFDSGATSHMCHSKTILKGAKEVAQHINVANNAESPVIATGTVKLTADVEGNSCDLTMANVLCIPDLALNLLSVSKICNNGYRVVFMKDACEVRSQSNELVVVGREAGGLYKLCLVNKEVSCAAKEADDMVLWHRRMGHLHHQSLKQLRDMATGIRFRDATIPTCTVCLQGKQHRQSFKKKGTRVGEVLELVHSDLCGPMENVSIGESRYFLTFIDDASRKVFVYFLKSKKQVLDCFKNFKAYAENQTGKRIKRLRTDNGSEYMNQEMERFLRSSGIHHETTVPYNPEQNGLAERMNRTVVEKARCLLFDAELEKRFWAEAVATAVFLVNRSPTKGLDVTPEEAFSGKKPDLSELRVFGTKVMCHIPKVKRQKWDAKSEPGIFVGYAVQSKGFRVYVPRTKKVVVSRDVVFLSEIADTTVRGEPIEMVDNKWMQLECSDPVVVDNPSATPSGNDDETDNESDLDSSIGETDYGSANDTVVTVSSPALSPQQEDPQNVVRRSARERIPPGKYTDYDMTCSILPQSVACPQEIDEPQSFAEAMGCGDQQLWQKAMVEEFESLKSNDTWELTKLPQGRKALKCKWVYKLKTNADGSVQRYKARLVIKGFSQVKGVDYNETYSPVVRYASIRYLLGLAAQMDLRIYQMDAVTAFLQGDLTEEEIFMEQPEGFVDKKDPKKVCRLRKALYGLKQASRVWNGKLDAELKQIGLKRSSFDPCVYYKVNGDRVIIIAVYVDDFLVFSNQPRWVEYVKEQLMSKFHMKDLGKAEQVLGMRITRAEDAVMLDQQRYIDELLRRFNMIECNPVATPVDGNQRLSKEMSPKDECEKQRMTSVPFRELIGGLQFLAQCTRPDIAYAVNSVSSFSSNPGEAHWTAAKRILRYLKGTKLMKLVYMKQEDGSFKGFSDADWGNDPESRRSITGYVFQFAGGLVSWSCRKQPTVALSTTEAEYMAMSAATQEALWWRGFQNELFGVQLPVQISCDNRSAICLAEKEIGYSPRSKHIDLRHHFVREQVELKTIVLQYVESKQQKADVLTKPITGRKFQEAIEALGVARIHV